MKRIVGRIALGRPVRTGLLAVVLAGCGNLTVGGLGEASVVVSGDDAPPSTPALAASGPTATASADPTAPLPTSHEEAEGEVEVEFMLFLVAESGSATRLGEDEMRVRVDVQGRFENDVVDREKIPTARYVELQIVFTEISAEIESGLVIDGVPVVGEIRVEMEDLALPVSRALDLEVGPGDSVELVVDLNAPAWLQAVDPLTRLVDVSVFEDLLGVRVR